MRGTRIERRQLIVGGAGGAALLASAWALRATGRLGGGPSDAPAGAATSPLRPSLPGSRIPLYQQPLAVIPAMPRTKRVSSDGRAVDYYEVAARQFRQQVLPEGLPATLVWGYGSPNHRGSFSTPGHSIEATVGTPVRVRWINDLRDRRSGRYLRPLLPVDPTLLWANPPGGRDGRNTQPRFDATPDPYTGPVPMVVHLHGGENTTQESDGHPAAWFLPDATDIPDGFATTGSVYDAFLSSSALADEWEPGTAVFEYPNDQAPATLWYHDHAMGMTRLSVQSGLAGLYLLRGDEKDGAGLPRDEIPLAIQDASFNADGSRFYPGTREALDGFAGPYVPDSDVAPIWVPGFLGDAIVVNGRTWPFLEVEPRRYRFRILNACGSRTLILENERDLPFWQIGSDGGFLARPVARGRLVVGPAERMDVIVDFSQVPVGTKVVLRNVGPENGGFRGGQPGVDFPPSNPATTGQVLQFRVVDRVEPDRSAPPEDLQLAPGLAARATTGPASPTVRRVSLNDVHSDVAPRGHLMGRLGTVNPDGTAHPVGSHHEPTETPRAGETEIWEILNFAAEAHAIHVHATQFRVLGRRRLDGGAERGPDEGETGPKDTVMAYPGEITRIEAPFNQPGEFVWHCHLLEHEDNDMMRPLVVTKGPRNGQSG